MRTILMPPEWNDKDQPCLCLCLGFSQITLILPLRLMILHFSQIGFTDDLTFTAILLSSKPPCFLKLCRFHRPGRFQLHISGEPDILVYPGAILDKLHPASQQSRHNSITLCFLLCKYFFVKKIIKKPDFSGLFLIYLSR